jgi:alanine racemase
VSGVERLVDLDAFAANLARIRATVAPAEMMLVVKNDAYRHGLHGTVNRALRAGVRWFGAFDVQTGERVSARRDDGHPDVRVFIWSLGDERDAARAVAQAMDIGIGDLHHLRLVTGAAAAAGTTARVHLKIDTGLHRNGFRPEQWPAVVGEARAAEEDGTIRVEGIWSHLAEASDAEDDAARAGFDAAVAAARDAGLSPSVLHLAASAAAFARPEFRYDLVRIGAFAYGIRSAGGPPAEDLGIVPVLTVRAAVTSIEGDRVHVGLGSVDGLPSTLAGRMEVDTAAGPVRVLEIHPHHSVVAAWPGAAVRDTVTVFGPPEAAGRSATDLAELIDTIGEEIVLRIEE